MFLVKRLPPDPARMRPILSGLTFGFFDQPVTFELTADNAPGPFLVEFVVSRDKEKKPFSLEVTRVSDNTTRVSFFNPNESGTSGLVAPILLVASGGTGLGFMFLVDVIAKGEALTYRVTYEFGEAPYKEPNAEDNK